MKFASSAIPAALVRVRVPPRCVVKPRFFLPILFFFVLGAPAWASEGDPLRILLVGNSYTQYNRLGDKLEALLVSATGARTEVVRETAGGMRFIDHIRRDSVHRKRGPWNFIGIQAQSREALRDPAAMKENAGILIRQIQKLDAQPILFMTWPRLGSPGDGERIAAVYRDIATEHQAWVAPVGEVFEKVRELSPELHRRLYDDDGSHPSPLGTWLAALVFYEILSDQNVESLAPPDGIEPKIFRTFVEVVSRSTGTPRENEDR